MLKETCAGDGGMKMATAYIDKKLYSIPHTQGYTAPTSFLWIRKDWLDNLGMSVPTSYADVVKIAEAFKNNDPDKNGKNDTLGLGLCNEMVSTDLANIGSIEGVLNAFGGFSHAWIRDDDGTITYGPLLSGSREGIAALRDLFAKGLIDPEFGIKTSDKLGEDVAGGRLGIFYGGSNFVYTYGRDCMVNFPKATWMVMAAPSVSGGTAVSAATVAMNYYYAVNAKCEHPEALIKMANLFQERINSRETTEEILAQYGIDPVTGVDMAGYAYGPQDPVADKGIRDQNDIRKVLDGTAGTDILYPEALRYYKPLKEFIDAGYPKTGGCDPKNLVAWQYYMIHGPESYYRAYTNQWNDNKIKISAWFGTPTDTMSQKGSTLDKMQAEVFTKIITGSAPLEDYDKFITDWNNLGGKEITKELTEWYNKTFTQ